MKGKSLTLLVFFILFFVSFGFGQQDKVLLKIENEEILLDEFERIYSKNAENELIEDTLSAEDYLELFIDFKLKVYDAKQKGLHLQKKFKDEYEKYIHQLNNKYLFDPGITENLVKEAYERLKYDVRASHILIRCDINASPEDTLYAYNKIERIRGRILGGENFESVARSTSDDPSVKSNGGDLGYFNAFRMVYEFENAAYSTPVGEVSSPIRTKFGYHLVKVFDKRPSQGEVKVAHIMFRMHPDAGEEVEEEIKERADLIYNRLINGEDFSRLAKQFSEDPGTAKKGGELPWFSNNSQLPEGFIKESFALTKNDELSKPFKTPFGYHIVKRIDRRVLGSFDDIKDELTKKVASDSRSLYVKKMYLDKLKRDYEFELYKDQLELFHLIIDSTLVMNSWKAPEGIKTDGLLIKFADQNYSQSDFIDYLEKYEYRGIKLSHELLFDRILNAFIEEKLIAYETSLLVDKHPELRHIYKEYFEGILLFEISDQMIWSKAVQDTIGLKEYFQKHQENYLWDERIEVFIAESDNEDLINELTSYIERKSIRRVSIDYIQDKFEDSLSALHLTQKKYKKNENKFLNDLEWKENYITKKSYNSKFYALVFKEMSTGDLKSFQDAKGQVISDYQKHLEAKWLKDLRLKYKVIVNEELLNQLNQK